MRTLLLDVDSWDLAVDATGNIALANDPYSQAQDAASAIKVFQGECYYNTTKGIPYWTNVLGYMPPQSLIKSYVETAALTVPGTKTAVSEITSFINRKVTGKVLITNTEDQTSGAIF